MLRSPGDQTYLQGSCPPEPFPWKAATAILKCEQPETTKGKERHLEVLGGLTIQSWNKRNNMQLKFFLTEYSSIEMIFPDSLGFEFCVVFCS